MKKLLVSCRPCLLVAPILLTACDGSAAEKDAQPAAATDALAEVEVPKISRGGYAILPQEEIDKIVEYKIASGQLVLAAMRKEGDTLTKPRAIGFSFYGQRADLVALRDDKAFAGYRVRDLIPNELDQTPDRLQPFLLVLEIDAVPDDALLERVERPHLLKAMEYDLFYDGFDVDFVADGQKVEGWKDRLDEQMRQQSQDD